MGVVNAQRYSKKPNPDFIESVGYSSSTEFFRSSEYRLALIEYRKTGLFPEHPIEITAQQELAWIRRIKNL